MNPIKIEWQEDKIGGMPEDLLSNKKYRLWGKDRKKNPYVLVLREHRFMFDCAMRVQIEDGLWAWSDGDGITPITHWAYIERPYWDEEAHQKYLKEIHEAWKIKK